MSEIRRHSMMGGSARQKVKIEYSIRIKEIAGLPKSTTGVLFLSWKRGSKKENSGETKHVPVKDQKADFDVVIPLTLYQDPKKGFEEKSVVFTLKEEKGKKPNTLGKLAIDLAEFANSKTERIRTFQIKEKKTPVANITLSFKTTWLKMDGKTLLKADQSDVTGKEKVHIDGNDYYLQTEDELSIDETDQKSGGGNDSDEEGVVDFESDNETAGGYPRSPNNRKSVTLNREGSSGGITNVSSLLSKAAPSTPNQSTSTASPSPSPSLAPPSTSPAPSIQVTSPGTDTKDGEDPKVKKYKKKLKTARKEADDLKVELAKKDELVKAAQQGGAASEKEQQAKETEAKLRAELDEANKRAADAQATVEANKKGGDKVNQQKDTKINQLEEALRAKETEVARHQEALSVAQSQNDQGRADLESKWEREISEERQRFKAIEDAAGNKIKELENELQEEKKRNTERESQRQLAEGSTQELQQTLESEKQKAREWEAKYKQVEEQLSQSSSTEEKVAELEKQLATEKETSAAEIARLSLIVVALQKEKYEKAQLEEELKRVNADHRATVESLQANIASLEEQIRAKESSQQSQEGERESEISLLKDDLSASEARALQAEKQAEQLRSRLTESENETSNAKKRLEEEVQRLQQRTKELEMQLTSDSGKDNQLVLDMQSRTSDLETQLNDAVASKDEQAKEIAQLNATLQELEQEKEDAVSAKNSEKKANKQLEADLEDLRSQISSLEAQVQAGDGKEAVLIAELQSKNKRAEEEIQQLQQQLEDAENARQEKERELEQSRESSNATSDSQVQELEADVQKYKKKAKKAEQQALELEKELDEAKEQLQQQQQNGGGSEEDERKYIELDKKYRAVKTRIDELDDEADRLRKREVVLTELNETSEKRIEELEAELKTSKHSEGANGSNGTSEEVSELQKELDEMTKQTATLKVRVRELEEEAAARPYQESSKALAGSGALALTGGSEDVVRLQKELEEIRKVEKAIYWDEIGYTPADISKTATSVWQLLAATRELDAEDQPAENPLTPLAQKVINALDKSFRRVSGDNKQIAYWLSCTCSLLHFIHQRDDIPPSADPVLQGVQVNREYFVSGPSHAEQFARALQDLALNVYGQIAVNFQEHIQKLIIPAFLHEDQTIMDAHQKGTIRTASQAAISSPPSSPLHNHHATVAVPSLTLLTNTLSKVHTLLRDAKCPAAVIRQFFHQLLHFISGCVLNALLYGKEVSTATHGLRIKLAVSRIDEWLAKQENDIAGTGERLNLLRDTANVLVLDKSLFLDADTITSIFHTLNLVQVKKLLDLFQPDAVSPSGVPAGVRQMMDSYWGYSPHNMPLLVDVTAFVVI